MLVLRSVLGALIGLFLISLIVEPLEFSLVTIVNGGVIGQENQDEYYAIRNRDWFLALKMVYNTLAAMAGGYAAAVIAGRAPLRHAVAVAVLQTAGFGVALATPQFRETAPLWMWIALIPVSIAGILLGGWLRGRTRRARRESTVAAPAGAGATREHQ